MPQEKNNQNIVNDKKFWYKLNFTKIIIGNFLKHIFIIFSIFLLQGCFPKKSPEVYVPSGEKCYVLVESSKEFDSSLLSNISISLISKYLRQVEQVPLAGISTDSCQYQVSVTKKDDTTFVTFNGEGLNSFGDSKLSGSDGFQQSIIKSLYRSLEDKRDFICQDYGKLLEECKEVIKKQSGILYGSVGESKWDRRGWQWKWYTTDADNRYGRYKGEIENGKPNGNGIVKTRNNEEHEGEWKDGMVHGYGTFTNPKGEKYEGEWKDGVIIHGKIFDPDGRIYEGAFRESKPNGQGTLFFPDGTKVVAVWKDGDPYNGFHYDKDGKTILAEFVDGEIIEK